MHLLKDFLLEECAESSHEVPCTPFSCYTSTYYKRKMPLHKLLPDQGDILKWNRVPTKKGRHYKLLISHITDNRWKTTAVALLNEAFSASFIIM